MSEPIVTCYVMSAVLKQPLSCYYPYDTKLQRNDYGNTVAYGRGVPPQLTPSIEIMLTSTKEDVPIIIDHIVFMKKR